MFIVVATLALILPYCQIRTSTYSCTASALIPTQSDQPQLLLSILRGVMDTPILLLIQEYTLSACCM